MDLSHRHSSPGRRPTTSHRILINTSALGHAQLLKKQRRTDTRFNFLTAVSSDEQRKAADLASRKRSKNWQKIRLENVSYTNTPFLPGFHFYSVFTQLRTYDLPVPVPDTLLVLADSAHYLHTNRKGRLVVKTEFSRLALYQKLKATPGEVAAVRKGPDATGLKTTTLPLSHPKLHDEVLRGMLPTNLIIQQFIKCWGERPCISRIFYISDTRNNRASYGFTITNSVAAYTQYSAAHSIVCVDYPEGFDLYSMQGKAIAELEQLAKQLVLFLQRMFGVRVQEIVLDFIKDANKQYWLIGCQGFRLDLNVLMAREIRIQSQHNKSPLQIKEEQQAIRDSRLSSIQCKLCLFSFKSNEMDAVLPFNMLLLYKRRTKLSGRRHFNLSHIREKGPNYLSYWVRVCQLCYMLLKLEYELLSYEAQLAQILHVPLKSEDLSKKPRFEHPAFLPTKVCQWRLLLYFSRANLNVPAKNLSIKCEFLGTSFEGSLQMRHVQGEFVGVCYLKLFYVFAPMRQAMKELCRTERLNLQLYTGNKMIGIGHCVPFKDFSCNMNGVKSLAQEQLICLTGRGGILQVHCGIAQDQELNPRKLPVDIRKASSVYLPGESYFTSDTLPASWMELFSASYKEDAGSEYPDSEEELGSMYKPLLDPPSIFVNPLGSKSVLHLDYSLNPLESVGPRTETTTSAATGKDEREWLGFRQRSEAVAKFIPIAQSTSSKRTKNLWVDSPKVPEAQLISSISKFLANKQGASTPGNRSRLRASTRDFSRESKQLHPLI